MILFFPSIADMSIFHTLRRILRPAYKPFSVYISRRSHPISTISSFQESLLKDARKSHQNASPLGIKTPLVSSIPKSSETATSSHQLSLTSVLQDFSVSATDQHYEQPLRVDHITNGHTSQKKTHRNTSPLGIKTPMVSSLPKSSDTATSSHQSSLMSPSQDFPVSTTDQHYKHPLRVDHITNDHTYQEKNCDTYTVQMLPDDPTFSMSLDGNLVLKAQSKLAHLQSVIPSAACALCGKIVYPSTTEWVALLQKDWVAKGLIRDDSPVKIQLQTSGTVANESSSKRRKTGNDIAKVSVCSLCRNRYKTSKQVDLFQDFGEVPQCFKQLSSYQEYRKLSIASIYCSTFKPPGYAYLHSAGSCSVSPNLRNYRGMIGMLHVGCSPELETSNVHVRTCIHWLRKNNPLYTKFLANIETILGYFSPTTANSALPSLSSKTADITFAIDGQLPVSEIKKQEGLLFPANDIPAPMKPIQLSDMVIGKEMKMTSDPLQDYAKEHPIRYTDECLEAKIFPHLFPYGQGSWFPKSNALTIGQYHKLRLLHCDRRWACDRFYPFFAFDRNMKHRLSFINSAIATNKNRSAPITAESLNNSDSYYKYGTTLTSTISGSKAYWQRKWLDLVAMVAIHGPPDIFFTLTANDSWQPLKQILSQYEQPTSIIHPVDTTVYFFERFKSLKPLLYGQDSVFGKVDHHWHRIETQNRGALHVHGLIWVKNGTLHPLAVSGLMPRGCSKDVNEMRKLVQKFQIHKCRPNKCFRTLKGKATSQCKYGFPFPLREEDGFDEELSRYEYKRLLEEDSNVVPYNPYLLLAWDGHINVQKVTNTGFVRYLVKYISKVEPTFGLKIDGLNDVQKYLETRLISAPEAIAYTLSYPMVYSSDQVLFIDTSIPKERTRVLKPKHQVKDLDSESTEIFVPAAREHYMNRPDSDTFSNMTFPEYICNYTFTKVKPKQNVFHMDQENNFIVKRNKALIPRYRFLTPLDGEAFYYQELLTKVPFREDTLLSKENKTGTYKEECYRNSLFDYQSDIDVAFENMKQKNFDPRQIAKVAKKMLAEQLSDSDTLKKKIKDLGYGEEIPFENEDLDNYESVEVGDFPADQNESINKMIIASREKLIADKHSLTERITQFTKSQKDAFEFVTNSDKQILAFITGPGGTGKSFLLQAIVNQLEQNSKIIEVLATSGNAALLIGGQTIHSFFLLNPELQSRIQYEDTSWKAIALTDTIIIDEISMMTAELLEKIESICRETVIEKNKQKLFGGKSIILFGDLYQLPAVTDFTSPRQIFESSLWNLFSPLILTQNCRQKDDPQYADILGRIRTGLQTPDDILILKSRVCGAGHIKDDRCSNFNNSATVLICSKHTKRNELNSSIMEQHLKNQPLYTLYSKDYDASGMQLSTEESHTISCMKNVFLDKIVIRKQSRVMVTRNLDIQGGVVNGTSGILIEVHPKILIMETDSGLTIPVPRVKQRIIFPVTNTVVYRVQFPIILSWACTVHRVQGTTLNTAHISLDNTFFAPGQAYVALSRVQSMDNLHLLKLDESCFITSPAVSYIMNVAQSEKRLISVQLNKYSPSLNKELTSTIEKQKSNNTQLSTTDAATLNEPSHQVGQKSSSKAVFSSGVQDMNPTTNLTSSQDQIQISRKIQAKHLPLKLFGTNTYDQSVVQRLHHLQPILSAMLSKCRASDTVPFDPTIHQKHTGITCKIHPAMQQSYIPVVTTGDGNCVWNSIALSLYGNEKFTNLLKLLTLQTLISQSNYFKSVIRYDLSSRSLPCTENAIETNFANLVFKARKWREWGDEFHLLALSIALQRDIYTYCTFQNFATQDYIPPASTTSEELQHMFLTTQNVGVHLLHCCPPHLRMPDYNSRGPCVNFFDPNSAHYTAVLKSNHTVPLFTPTTSIFPAVVP